MFVVGAFWRQCYPRGTVTQTGYSDKTMQRILGLILSCLVVISSPDCLPAARPSQHTKAPLGAKPYTQGLFWKISRASLPSSYLYGTMHLDVPAVTHLPPQANMAFARARVFIAEVRLDGTAQADYARAGWLPANQHLSTMLPAEAYARLVRIAADYGASAEMVDRMKPWLATNLISRPRPRNGVVLDELLQRRAMDMLKPIVYLETMTELTGKLDKLPVAVQREILRDTIVQRPLILQEQAKELEAYLREDLGALLADTSRPHHDEAAFRQFNDLMLHQRTANMIRHLVPELVRGNAFIAIGAAHLPGSRGLLQQLARKGFNVSAILQD